LVTKYWARGIAIFLPVMNKGTPQQQRRSRQIVHPKSKIACRKFRRAGVESVPAEIGTFIAGFIASATPS
jgi:hypothetical protein